MSKFLEWEEPFCTCQGSLLQTCGCTFWSALYTEGRLGLEAVSLYRFFFFFKWEKPFNPHGGVLYR